MMSTHTIYEQITINTLILSHTLSLSFPFNSNQLNFTYGIGLHTLYSIYTVFHSILFTSKMKCRQSRVGYDALSTCLSRTLTLLICALQVERRLWREAAAVLPCQPRGGTLQQPKARAKSQGAPHRLFPIATRFRFHLCRFELAAMALVCCSLSLSA